MKKLCALLTALVLVTLPLLSLALTDDDFDWITITPKATNSKKYTAVKWMSSEENRALLSLLLHLDIAEEKIPEVEALELDMFYEGYIYRFGNEINLLFAGDQGFLIVNYFPAEKTVRFFTQPVDRTGVFGKLMMPYLNTDGYYQHRSSMLMSVAKQILESQK